MKQLVQIVDKDDQLIGHKPAIEVDYQKDIYRTACIWLENSAGNVLLAQRKWDRQKDPGMWGPAAAGTLEDSENYESTAHRELVEEIGVTDITLKTVTKIWEGVPRQHYIQVFRGTVDWPIEQFKIQEAEVEQVAWVSKAELTADVATNPTKYVPSMSQLIKLFCA